MHTPKRLLFLASALAIACFPLFGRAATIASTAVDHIVIQPNDRPTIVDQQTDMQFIAAAFSATNEVVPGVTFVWGVGGDIGTIAPSGIFTGTRGGTGQVIAKTGNVTASVGVVVRATATKRPPANTNTSIPVSTNTAQQPTTTVTESVIEPAPETQPTDSQQPSPTTSCTTLRTWVWVLLVLGFALFLFIYFLTLGDSRTPWWWMWPLLSTAVLVALHNALRCGSFSTWIPWSIVILGILNVTFYLRVLRPKEGSHAF